MKFGYIIMILVLAGFTIYSLINYILKHGILDILVGVFVFCTIIGTLKLIQVARSGNHL